VPSSSPRGPLRALRALPLWARWLLTGLAWALVVVAVIVLIHDVNSSSSASRSEVDAEAEANREGQIAIRQDEAPHVAALGADVSAQGALERAIAADARARVAHGQLTGPLQSVRCSSAGATRDGRRPFRCTVESAGISYPFMAVADERARRLTWCKVDPPPTPGAPLEVPISASCRT
jgi:hypothetical protein